MTWADITFSNTTLRNASRFIAATPTFGEASVDFYLAFTSTNPAIFTEIDPKAFSQTTSNEP